MAADMINEILKAEANGKKLEKQAEEYAQEIICKAQEQADEIIRLAVEQANNQANIILSDAQYSSLGVLKQAQKLSELRERKSINDTEKLYENAIKLILEAVVN